MALAGVAAASIVSSLSMSFMSSSSSSGVMAPGPW